jgi:hypothetical protein
MLLLMLGKAIEKPLFLYPSFFSISFCLLKEKLIEKQNEMINITV